MVQRDWERDLAGEFGNGRSVDCGSGFTGRLNPVCAGGRRWKQSIQWFQNLAGGAGNAGDFARVQVRVLDGGSEVIPWQEIWTHDVSQANDAQRFVSVDLSQLVKNYFNPRLQARFIWDAKATSTGGNWEIEEMVIGSGSSPKVIDGLDGAFADPVTAQINTVLTDEVVVTDNEANATLQDQVFYSFVGAPTFMTLTSQPGEGGFFSTTVKAAPSAADMDAYSFYLLATDSQNLRWVREITMTVVNEE